MEILRRLPFLTGGMHVLKRGAGAGVDPLKNRSIGALANFRLSLSPVRARVVSFAPTLSFSRKMKASIATAIAPFWAVDRKQRLASDASSDPQISVVYANVTGL